MPGVVRLWEGGISAHISCADAGRMLIAIGSGDFTRYSRCLYGRPDRVYRNQGLSPVDVARFFLKLSEELLGSPHLPDTVADLPARDFADSLRLETAKFFVHDPVEVVLDPGLASKASSRRSMFPPGPPT